MYCSDACGSVMEHNDVVLLSEFIATVDQPLVVIQLLLLAWDVGCMSDYTSQPLLFRSLNFA